MVLTMVIAALLFVETPLTGNCYQRDFKPGGDGTFEEVVRNCTGETRRLAFHFTAVSVGVVNYTPLKTEVVKRVMDRVQDIFIVPMKDVQAIVVQTIPLGKASAAMVLVERVFQFAPGEPFSSWPSAPIVRMTIGLKGANAEHILETAIREGVKRRPALCKEEEPCETEPCEAVEPCEAEVEFVIPPPKTA